MQTHANCYLGIGPPPGVKSISGINRRLLGCSLVSPPFVKSISFRNRQLSLADFLRKCFLRLVSLWAQAKRFTLANANTQCPDSKRVARGGVLLLVLLVLLRLLPFCERFGSTAR